MDRSLWSFRGPIQRYLIDLGYLLSIIIVTFRTMPALRDLQLESESESQLYESRFSVQRH